MPTLQVNLSDPADVQSALDLLTRHQAATAAGPRAGQPIPLARAMAMMKRKKIWKFLDRVAKLDTSEYSLPELGKQVGLTSGKVGSLKAILAKPEQRLGLKFLEPASSGSADAAGNPRYQMPRDIRQAIHATG